MIECSTISVHVLRVLFKYKIRSIPDTCNLKIIKLYDSNSQLFALLHQS